ncbi:MAG: prolyl oligopeptidase family serine peptidase [Candidatus Delongbacteria bacterium]|nr:prolyl oligopeptidase family serine peptidase [Candidatus Delongbacteria bacterium]
MSFLAFNESKEGYLGTFMCSKPIKDKFFLNLYRRELLTSLDQIGHYYFENKSHWDYLHSSQPTIDFNQRYNVPRANYCILAYTAIEMENDYSALLEHGGKANLRLWINGNLLIDFLPNRNDQDLKEFLIPISLLKGINHVLLEVLQNNANWDFSIKLMNYNNLPLKDYKILIPYESDDIDFAHSSLFDSLQVDIQNKNIQDLDELNLILHSELNSCVFPDTMTASIQISTQDHRICFDRKLKHLPQNIFRFNFNRVELDLAPGFYFIELVFESLLYQKRNQVGFFILMPEFYKQIESYYKKLKLLKEELKVDPKQEQLYRTVLPALENNITFLEEIWANPVDGENDYHLIQKLVREVETGLENLGHRKDPFKEKTGYIRAAYYHEKTGNPVPYSLYVTKEYHPDKPCPLVIGLHGLGSNHYLQLRRLLGLGNNPHEKDSTSLRNMMDLPDRGCIFMAINGFGSIGYDSYAEEDFFTTLAIVKSKYNIDENRIYLVGLSMGGTGALYFLTHYPDYFAAGAILCPLYDMVKLIPNTVMSRLTHKQKHLINLYNYYNYLENVQDIPLYIFHGTNDSVISVENSRQLVSDLNALGFTKVYIEFSNMNHNVWDIAANHDMILSFLFKHSRKPKELYNHVYQTGDLKYNRFDFMEIQEAHRNRNLMRIEIHQQDDRIYLNTKNIKNIMFIKDLMNFKKTTELIVNGMPVEIPKVMKKDLFFEIGQQGIERISKYTPLEITPPRQGLVQAFKEWHTFVISNSIDKKMKKFLNTLTSIPCMEQINFPIRPAETIDLSDDSLGHIILVGTPDSNIHIAKLLQRMKIEYNYQKIVMFGHEFHGSPIQVIFHFYNPFNPSKEIVCYLVSHPDFIPEEYVVHNIWFGAPYFNDYFVFNKEEMIFSDVYEHDWPAID